MSLWLGVLGGQITAPPAIAIDAVFSAGGDGVTVNSEGSKLRINAQWQAVTLIKRATNTWVVIGAIKT